MTKLKTLRGRSPDEVEDVIGAIATKILPNPRIEEEYPGVSEELQRQVLMEVQAKLKLKPDDKSPKALGRLYDFFSNALYEAAMGPRGEEEVRSRLGQRGELGPRMYLWDITSASTKELLARGIRRNHVADAISRPDRFQHLLPEVFGADGIAISLYMQEHGEGRDRFSLLVLMVRVGYRLEVRDAWRVYHSDVDTSNVKEPLDLLRALADRYGWSITYNGESKKLHLYTTIRTRDGIILQPDDSLSISPDERDGLFNAFEEVRANPTPETSTEEFGMTIISRSRGDEHDIALAMALGMNEYLADLRSHGVSVEQRKDHQ